MIKLGLMFLNLNKKNVTEKLKRFVTLNEIKEKDCIYIIDNFSNIDNFQEITEIIVMKVKLSQDFIDKYYKYFKLKHLARYQLLSEEFIDKHRSCFDWRVISKYQVYISEKFIEKHKQDVHWNSIVEFNSNITNEYRNEIIKYLKDKKNYRRITPYN